jgi:hypothetical protein
MIVPAHSRWPRRIEPIAVTETVPDPRVDEVFDLIDRAMSLTRESAVLFDDGATDDGLDLLDQRAPLFARLGEIFGELAGPAGPGGKFLPGAELDRITFAAGELGRLDAVVSARLTSLRGDLERDLDNLRPNVSVAPGYTGSEPPRHLDRRG